MRYRLAVIAGRLARWLLRLRGGGSAVPGRVALAIAPKFLERAVSRLPLGVVFVSGSNGKSTTTNMLTAILREHGLDVFTNPSGGNLPQGIASALLADVPLDGFVRGDVGVIEVDEAYGVDLARVLKPRGSLLLNVQIDQLNRFFEPTRVIGMLRSIAEGSSEFVVVNADDDSLARVGAELAAQGRDVTTFAVAPSIIEASPNGLANVKDLSGVAAGTPPDPVGVRQQARSSERAAHDRRRERPHRPARHADSTTRWMRRARPRWRAGCSATASSRTAWSPQWRPSGRSTAAARRCESAMRTSRSS